MKNIKYIIFLFSFIYSQEITIDLPSKLIDNDFIPSKMSVSNAGIYLLDTDNRQIAFIANDGNVIYSGGYGNYNDAFIDPIDILTSKLGVWIVDRTENNLISFDHKLNYLRTLKFDDIYPILCGIDDWGNIYLYSELDDKIYKMGYNNSELIEFIDLSIYIENGQIPYDLFISKEGNIVLLYDESVFVFNRLGKLNVEYQIEVGVRNIYTYNERIFGINNSNKIIDIINKSSQNIPINDEIVNIYSRGKQLFLLFTNKIWIVNAPVE